MRSRLLLLLLFFATSSAAAEPEGYAHGKDHCYHFSAPPGWLMDNQELSASGVAMVFYPKGSTWNSASYAIYTRSVPRAPDIVDPIRRAVDDVVTMYAASSEVIEATRLQAVEGKSRSKGEIWQFSGYSNGGFELVAYFLAPSSVNFFVAQISDAAEIEEAMHALVELSSSYREADDCKPCVESKSCGGRS